jgi:hypothetical protein
MTFDTVLNRRILFTYQQKHHSVKKTTEICRDEPRGLTVRKGACKPLDQDLPSHLTTRHKQQ